MLAISCKKTTTENPPTQLRDTQTSIHAVIGALSNEAYFKQNVILSFNGKATLSSAVDGDGNAVEGITYDSSTGIVNFDAITNNTELQKSGNVSNYTLTFSVAGETNGTFQIPVTLRKANIITNGSENTDFADNTRTLSNAIYNQNGIFGGATGYTSEPFSKYVFNENRWFSNDVLIFSNNQDATTSQNLGNQTEADTIRNAIMNNGKYTDYFSDLQVTFDYLQVTNSSGDDAEKRGTNAYFNVVFTPHFSNEMTNAGNYQLILKTYMHTKDN